MTSNVILGAALGSVLGAAIGLSWAGGAWAQGAPAERMQESCMAASSTQNFDQGGRAMACTCMVNIMMTADVDDALTQQIIDDFDGSVGSFRESYPELLERIRDECAPS